MQGRKEGREEGWEKGLLEGIAFAVDIKFGDGEESKTIVAKIRNIRDINRLKALKGKIKSAGTISELIPFIE